MCFSPLLFAEAANDYGEAGVVVEYEDRRDKSGHVELGPLSRGMDAYLEFKRSTFQTHGFNYTVEVAPQYQYQADGDGGVHANNETNFILQWSLVDAAQPRRGNLLAWYQWSDTWGGKTTSEFADRAGVLSPPNGGDTAPGKSRDLTQHFAWEQWLGDDHWRLMAGKLTTRVLFNLNRYTVSDREDFYTPMLVNNPVAHYTARIGLGAFLQYRRDDWYVSGMVRDADADLSERFIDFDSVDSGNWEYVSEVGLTPGNFMGMGQGNYRLTLSYSDATDNLDSTYTASFSGDQDLGDDWGVFMRYAWADDTFRTFEQRLAAGVQMRRPLGFVNDRLGVGAWWGRPVEAALDDEYGLDLFWKFQISPWLELSPGLQFNMNPAAQPDRSKAVFAQMRLRVVL
ncbi:MAG: hypothetical protein Hals2KO_12780 [Halioglobus sp.]